MLYVYGTGNFGEIIGKCLLSENKKFIYIDAYTDLTELFGVPIKRPCDVCPSSDDVIYNTVLRDTENKQREITRFISDSGFKNIVGYEEIWQEFLFFLNCLHQMGNFGGLTEVLAILSGMKKNAGNLKNGFQMKEV